jgi:signal transduction histidine kinase/HAMP domain-containing protein
MNALQGNGMKKLFGFERIRTQLTVALLLVALVPLVIVGLVIYEQQVQSIKAEAFNKLQGIRDIKVHEVEDWIRQRSIDVSVMSGDEETRHAAEALATDDESPEARDAIRRANALVRRVQKGYGVYEEIFVVSANSGKIVLSTDASHLGEDRSDDVRFQEPLRTGELFIRDIYFSTAFGKPSMALSAPVFGVGEARKAVGVLIARVGLENSLYDLLLDRTGMGKTGETLIVNQDSIALNELRYRERAPLKLEIHAEPAVRAAQGNTGVTETEDYRGEMVLAAYTHIGAMKWGFVAKQDLAEVYAPIRSMVWNLLLVMAVTGTVVAALSFFLAGTIVRPVLNLTRVSNALRRGDLTARSSLQLSNELGQLADSFNVMGEALSSQMEVRAKSATICDCLTSSPDLSVASQSLIEELIEITDSILAVFYVRDADEKLFKHGASIGANAELMSPFDASILEGGLGKALSSKQICRVFDIPEDTRFLSRTASGTIMPKEILSIPLVVEEKVLAVVCLASIKPYSKVNLEALEQAWPSLNVAMANLSANRKSFELAQQLSSRNQELEAQTCELKAQAGELTAQAVELKAQAAELEAQRFQVQEADRLKSEFLSNMSHELRTPLNSVITLSELMSSRGAGKNPEKDAEYLRIIQHNGYHLLSLINDILDLSKIEAGRMDVSRRDFKAALPLERALDTTRPLAAKKGLRLNVRRDEDPTMHSDEDKVYQILLNLVSNAVKFTEEGAIDVSISEEGEKILFSVADTGTGIADFELGHIFDEFRQVDGSTTRQHEGTGLGLAICQRLARLLGGEINVKSVLGEGRETKQPCFDLILSDIEMPRMDGLRLTDKIKEDAFLRRTPVVLFSSRCDAKGEANKRLSPADAEVRKFEYKNLIAAITMCLHQ